MSGVASGLYVGRVTHRRLRPRPHALAYRVFSLLLDLDEIDGLSRRLRLFSRNRFNLFSFHDRDYGAGTTTPLRTQVEGHMRAAGLEPDGGPIRLLTLPRILGYVFNPLSIYFCYRRAGMLAAILYEVSNTFGDRHGYLMPVADEAELRQQCRKALYVSPFLDMAMTYAFRVVPPADRLKVSIAVSDADGPTLTAVLTGGRRELSDTALGRAFAGHPFLTLKVIVGIHWEALRIWLKGVHLRRRPLPPASAVTFTPGSLASPHEE